jgi:hypothetical protein
MYQQKAKERLHHCQKDFEAIQSHSTAEHQRFVKALFIKQENAHQHLRALEQANDSTWSMYKQKLEHTLEQLHQDFQRLLDKMPYLTEQVSLDWTHDSKDLVETQSHSVPASQIWVEEQSHFAPFSKNWLKEEQQGQPIFGSQGWPQDLEKK